MLYERENAIRRLGVPLRENDKTKLQNDLNIFNEQIADNECKESPEYKCEKLLYEKTKQYVQ